MNFHCHQGSPDVLFQTSGNETGTCAQVILHADADKDAFKMSSVGLIPFPFQAI